MIGMKMDIPGGTQAHYDATMKNVGLPLGNTGGNWPKGLISHSAGPIPSGWRVVDIWESQADADAFFKERLHDALMKAGVPETQPEIWMLYNMHTA